MIRYAIYFAPAPDSALHDFGSAWLGRDAQSGLALRRPSLDGITAERLATITADPRRYGFHATLKPPFALASGRTAGQLVGALEAFTRERPTFEIPPLRVAEIGGFIALIPSAPSTELAMLAADAVREFDAFRAPPSAAERDRRMRAELDARERELLAQWGYPYVLDRWRFHMTLTERLEPSERAIVQAALSRCAAAVCRDALCVDAIALFVGLAPDEPFHLQSRFLFGGSTTIDGED